MRHGKAPISGKKVTFLALAVAVAGAGTLAGQANAATVDWNGSTTTNWSTATNWSALPANSLLTDIAEFGNIAFTNQPALTAAYSVNGIVDQGTVAAPVTISGPYTLQVGSAGIVLNAGAGNMTISTTTLYLDAAPTSLQPNTTDTASIVNASSSELFISVATWENGASLNAGTVALDIQNTGSGDIATTRTNTNGIVAPWVVWGTGANTQYATVTTTAGTLGGFQVGGLTTNPNANYSAVADPNLMTSGTINYDLSSLATPLAGNVTAYTIRYTGAGGTLAIPDGGTATSAGYLNAGTGTLLIAPAGTTGYVTFNANHFLATNSATGDIEFTAPIKNTTTSADYIGIGGPDKLLINELDNTTTGSITSYGYNNGGNSPLNGGVVYIGSSGKLNLNATAGNINLETVIADNPTFGPSTLVIDSTGSPVTGIVNLYGNNTFTGGVTVNTGAYLQLAPFGGVGGALGVGGTLTINPGAFIGGGNGYTDTNTNPSLWNGSFTVFSSGNAQITIGSGTVTLGNNVTVTFGVSTNTSARELTLGGAVVDNGHGYGITVLNNHSVTGGFLQLNGSNNTFTGPLTVGVAGTLTTVGGAQVTTFTDQYELGAETSGSPVITGLATTAGLVVGETVLGTTAGIPAGTRILSIDSATQVTLSANATATVAANTYYFGAGQYNLLAGGGVNGNVGLGGAANASWASNIVLNPSGSLQIGGAGALGIGTLTVDGGILASGGGLTLNTSVNYLLNDNFTVRPYNGTLNFGPGPVTLGQSVVMTTGWSENGHLGAVAFGGPIGDQGKGYSLTAQLGTGLFSAGLSLNGPVTIGGPVTINGLKLTIATGTFANYFGALNIVDGSYLNMYGVNYGLNRDLVVNIDATSTWTVGRETTVMLAGVDGAGNANAAGYDYANLLLTGSGNYAYSGGLIAGTSTGTRVVMAGLGTQSFSGANANNGATVVVAGTLNLDFSGPQTANSLDDNVDPAYSGYQSDILYHNAAAPGAGAGILNAGVTVAGGTLLLTGNPGAQDLQRLSTIGIGTGAGTIRLNANGATSLVLSTGGTLSAPLSSTANGTVNFDLRNSGTQSATNGVLTTATNLNGIIGGNVLVTTGAGDVDFAVSGATEVAGTWMYDPTSDDGSVSFTGSLANGTAVSFNTLTTGSGLTAGKLYYVVGGGGSSFKVVPTPGSTSPPLTSTSGASGTNTVDTQGNITALATHTTLAGDGTDLATDNAQLLGGLTLTAATNVYTLKIDNSTPGTLDLGGTSLFTAGGAILFTGSADYTISDGTLGSVAAANHTIIETYGTGVLTISATISGSTGGDISGTSLVKTGPGTLVLTGTNNYGLHTTAYQGLFIEQGIVNINGDAALGYSGSVVFNGGTLQYQSPGVGPLVDNGDLTANPLRAATVIVLAGGATVDTNGNNITWANNFGGGDVNGLVGGNPTGGFIKTGAGTLTLQGLGQYSGATTVSGGTLAVATLANGGVTSSIGQSGRDAPNLVLDGGTLQYTGSGASTDRDFTVTANGGTLDASGTGAEVFSTSAVDSPIAVTGAGARTLTLTGTSTATNSLGLLVGDGTDGNGGTTVLAKTGTGVWALTNANTYSGGTTVSGGTLLASNTTGSATGSANVMMNGGTLGGAGKISGTVVGGTGANTIAPSATLVGNTATTLTLGGLTTNSNTTLAFNLNTPYNTITHAASVSDQIVVNGTVNLSGGGTLSITNTNTGLPSLGYYKAIAYTTLTAPSSPTANLGITMPTVANGIAYVLDTSHDPGYIDIHRGFLGDANDDGIVNAIDLGILATNYNSTTANWSEGDYNGDGIVNAIDLGILATNYNAVVGAGSFDTALDAYPTLEAAYSGASSVPEPASLALLGIGAAGLLTRRRRRA